MPVPRQRGALTADRACRARLRHADTGCAVTAAGQYSERLRVALAF
jgi:hypothetical protein